MLVDMAQVVVEDLFRCPWQDRDHRGTVQRKSKRGVPRHVAECARLQSAAEISQAMSFQ